MKPLYPFARSFWTKEAGLELKLFILVLELTNSQHNSLKMHSPDMIFFLSLR